MKIYRTIFNGRPYYVAEPEPGDNLTDGDVVRLSVGQEADVVIATINGVEAARYREGEIVDEDRIG